MRFRGREIRLNDPPQYIIHFMKTHEGQYRSKRTLILEQSQGLKAAAAITMPNGVVAAGQGRLAPRRLKGGVKTFLVPMSSDHA